MKPTDFPRRLTQTDELTRFQSERALETLTSQNPERADAVLADPELAQEVKTGKISINQGELPPGCPMRPEQPRETAQER